MKMKRELYLLWAILVLIIGSLTPARAQHTLGLYGGYGMGTSRLYPNQETRTTWGLYTAGLSWRHYGLQRYVGGFGIDLEFIQHAFSYAPYASITEEDEEMLYYSRRLNSITVPIVWQPHIYIKQRVRIFLEAAATFSYRFGGSYQNEIAREYDRAEDWEGDYPYKTARDNRWGYGLAGGGGVSVLIRQFELTARVRYYFGLGDLLRNRNRYADNTTDGSENPFWATPLRSPLDNLTITIGLSYRFNKGGFDVWNLPRKKKREKSGTDFNYTAGSSSSRSGAKGAPRGGSRRR